MLSHVAVQGQPELHETLPFSQKKEKKGKNKQKTKQEKNERKTRKERERKGNYVDTEAEASLCVWSFTFS